MTTLRRYTLLGTTTGDGTLTRLLSTRPAGSIVAHHVDGRTERFELTDVPMHDGTFAAKPLDRYL